MEFKEDDYILGFWFGIHQDRNVLTTVKKIDNNNWFAECRLRQYVDDKHFDSQDKKSFWDITITDRTDEEVISKMNELFQAMKDQYFINDYEYHEVKGNAEKFMFIMAMQPWSQIQVMRNEKASPLPEAGQKSEQEQR